MLLFVSIQALNINHELMDPFYEAISDFEVTDIGFSKLKESDADTNIVIINIGNAENADIALLLRQISSQQPAVIGINKIFRRTGNGFEDSLLAMSMRDIPNLVLVTQLTDFNTKTGTWGGMITSDSLFWVYKEEFGERYAAAGFKNMPTTDRDFKTTRKFYPASTTYGIEDHFFPVELIKYKDSAKAASHISRKNEIELINYRGNLDKFFTIDTQDWIEGNFDPSMLKGKVVILGYMGETFYNEKFWDTDKYYTPMNNKFAGKTFPDMYETVIYANVASMILSDSHINVLPWYYNLLLNLVICFHVVVLFSILFHAAAVWWDVFSILIALLITIAIPFVTVIVFSNYNLEIDLNFSMVFALVSSSFLELYYGLFKIALQKLGVKFQISKEEEKRQKINEIIRGSAKDILSQGLTDFDFNNIKQKDNKSE
ncbi:MAG: CHASE2 domain-containing protein [Bacteroidota bacterium]|nr:CHASE2 domain-containing protein [Bacteroidota bacterium]